MAKQVFLSGHGGWKPKNGFTQVPKGCKINFYTSFAKNLITGMEYMILEGTYTTVDRTIDQFMSCPNMQLSAQPDDWTRTSKEKLATRHDADCILLPSPPGGLSLAGLFELWMHEDLPPVEFHWLACQTRGLKQVGGRSGAAREAPHRSRSRKSPVLGPGARATRSTHPKRVPNEKPIRRRVHPGRPVVDLQRIPVKRI